MGFSVPEGVLLVDKPSGKTSFSMVAILRKRSGQPKVGHSGTLDPFATGLLVLLFGRRWTRTAGFFLNHDKEYEACLRFGAATDTYDRDGRVTSTSSVVPSDADVSQVLLGVQGEYLQTPPMFSAKKVDGKRLYDLARKGVTVSREKQCVQMTTTLLSYQYPDLKIHMRCSKGTYVRSVAHDIGERLGCFAHVQELRRIRSGPFSVESAVTLEQLDRMSRDDITTRFFFPEYV
jgi:tRNA pseudouridine55 synthase